MAVGRPGRLARPRTGAAPPPPLVCLRDALGPSRDGAGIERNENLSISESVWFRFLMH